MMKTPGERIRNRRADLNYTQRELAKRAQVSHVTISKWESDDNEPAGRNLFQLAQALDCSPTWILYGDAGMEPSKPDETPEHLTLTEQETNLLVLFRSLPESEKGRHISDLEFKVDEFNKLFYELLKARKASKKK